MEKNTNSTVGRKYLPWNPKSVSRTRQDMKSWNQGLNLARLAEHPQNWKLQLIYDEVDLDALVSSQWNNRKNQVFSSDFVLKNKAGEIDEEQTLLLKKHPLYRNLTNAALDRILFGYSLVELSMKTIGGQVMLGADPIPRYNVVPQTGMFYPEYGDVSRFIKYRDLPEFGTWILEFNSNTLGLMNKLVAPALFSRFAEACWSELCEIYGIPPRVMKTNTQDATMLSRAEKMMRDMGSASWFIIDETEEFEFAKGVSTNGDVYKNLTSHCRDKICNLISGGMIGQNTENGNRAKDEVSMDVLWLLVQSDMAMLEEDWNTTIIPALLQHGVLKGELTFEFDQAEDVNQLWKFVQGLLPHYKIDPEWIKDKFGIEVTEEKSAETLSETLRLMLGLTPPSGEDDPGFFPEAPQVGACCGAHHIANLSLPKGSPKSEGLINRVSEANGELTFDPETFESTFNVFEKGLKKGMKSGMKGSKLLALDSGFLSLGTTPRSVSSQTGTLTIGTAYGIDDPHLLAAYEMNLFRFSAGKTLAQVQAINQAFRDSPSFDIFKINAGRIGDVFNERWLRTEYDTSVLVGESAATFHSLMRDVETFPFWEYKTAGDLAVRDEHAKLDGLILTANDPRWAKIFPPNGWNCRCYIVARTREEVQGINFSAEQKKVDDYFGSEDWERATKSGFGVNRAVTGEVFTANQQYLTGKNLTESRRNINDLEAKDYKLPPAADLITASKKVLPDYSESMERFIGDLSTLNGKPILTDYNQRALNFPTGITQGQSLLQAVIDTVGKPSEVWLKINPKGGYQLQYLNWYEGQAFEVIAYLSDLTLNLVSWKKIKTATAEAKRKGMLIRK